ncbi:nuclear transport factor 2 family protein [Pseudomonas sp. S36]|uniref:nuclear transport factor 2 family protein n=1 Tax=Pseudomonas sp. S36 TaxID=2767447 RepID=UPI00191495ED|nr:DUF4440 domain-containing protein [Pseudomonas sp. S36]MBK4988477.1 DUF4440 domain-containing protein [Pseudomonas sp. S36]
MDIRLQILALEALLLEPETRKNDRLLKRLLVEDFVEFGASGKGWTKAEVIAELKSETFIKRTIEDFKLRRLADSVALATYLCRHHPANGEVSLSLRSSVWETYGEGWQMVFHQGTRVFD